MDKSMGAERRMPTSLFSRAFARCSVEKGRLIDAHC